MAAKEEKTHIEGRRCICREEGITADSISVNSSRCINSYGCLKRSIWFMLRSITGGKSENVPINRQVSMSENSAGNQSDQIKFVIFTISDNDRSADCALAILSPFRFRTLLPESLWHILFRRSALNVLYSLSEYAGIVDIHAQSPLVDR